MLKMIIENDLMDIHNIVAEQTEYMGGKTFSFEGETFSLSVDTFKGTVNLFHENNSTGSRKFVRIRRGNYLQSEDIEVFTPLLNHLREMLRSKNSSSFFYFLLSNQVKH